MKRIGVLVMLLVFCTTVYAAPFDAAPYAQDENKLEIKGNARNSKVTLVITKSGSDEVIYADTALSDPKQGFRFILKPSANGLLDINVTADYETVGTKKTVSFVSVAIVERIEGILETGSKTELESLFGEEFTLNYFDLDATQYKSTEQIGAILYNLRSDMTDVTLIGNYVPLASEIVLLGSQADCSAFIAMAEDHDIELTSLSLYEKLSAEGKKNAALRISKADFGISEVDETFGNAVVFSGIETSEWSDSAVFYEAADIDSYNDASASVREMIQKELTGTAYADFETLEEDIKKIVKRVTKKASSTVSSSGSGGGGAGGSQSMLSAPVILPVEQPTEQPAETAAEKLVFSDVPETHWGFEAINNMHWQGIVLGYNDVFDPEREITRAEFAALLTRVLSLEDGAQSPFSDVIPDDWYYSSVSALYENEIIVGNGDAFYPDEKITRQDMAVMLDRVVKKLNHSLQYEEQSFSDVDRISGYAVEAVKSIANVGLMSGMGNGTFAPQQFATRAQATQIIYRLWKNNLRIA